LFILYYNNSLYDASTDTKLSLIHFPPYISLLLATYGSFASGLANWKPNIEPIEKQQNRTT